MPFFVLGYEGMPRRYYDYLPQYQSLHVAATIGSWILAAGFIVMFVNLYRSLRHGEKAAVNPWGAKTLEWTVSSPPPLENFHEIPTVTKGPYDFSEYDAPIVEGS
jgi:cytochrome c oxidase subunit 1